MDICCTLVSGEYFIGAAALINSLAAHGFQGEIHVGYTGEIPSWWPQEGTGIAPGISIVNIPVKTHRFLGYHKPDFMLSIINHRPQCTRLLWFDADIVVVTRWSFIQEWVDSGVAICVDIGFPKIWPLHPWRGEWRKLIAKGDLKEDDTHQSLYPNGGFLGMRAQFFSILSIWSSLTQAFEDSGGNINSYVMSERWRPVVGDQDLMAAMLMCWSGPLSPIGVEGMGFYGLAFPLCHGVESPKVWEVGALTRALSGAGVSLYRREFEKYIKMGPLKPMSGKTLMLRRMDIVSAIILSRFYKRGY